MLNFFHDLLSFFSLAARKRKNMNWAWDPKNMKNAKVGTQNGYLCCGISSLFEVFAVSSNCLFYESERMNE